MHFISGCMMRLGGHGKDSKAYLQARDRDAGKAMRSGETGRNRTQDGLFEDARLAVLQAKMPRWGNQLSLSALRKEAGKANKNEKS